MFNSPRRLPSGQMYTTRSVLLGDCREAEAALRFLDDRWELYLTGNCRTPHYLEEEVLEEPDLYPLPLNSCYNRFQLRLRDTSAPRDYEAPRMVEAVLCQEEKYDREVPCASSVHRRDRRSKVRSELRRPRGRVERLPTLSQGRAFDKAGRAASTISTVPCLPVGRTKSTEVRELILDYIERNPE